MIIDVVPGRSGAQLQIRDAGNLGELKAVIASDVTLPDAETALRKNGDVRPGGDVWVATAALRSLSRATVPVSEQEEWESRFDRMLSYAASKGWLNSDESLVAVHCEQAGQRVSLRTAD